jgi:hypothetical protein
MVTVFSTGGRNYLNKASSEQLICLKQDQATKAKLFTLTYGLQTKSRLSYAEACKALGEAILHYACNKGKASNEGD